MHFLKAPGKIIHPLACIPILALFFKNLNIKTIKKKTIKRYIVI